MTPSVQKVENIIRSAAVEVILPRFRNLAAHEVSEKEQGELVTIADHESEAILTTGLMALLPGSRVIGEEAAATDPGLFAMLADPEPVWLVDPVDGTRNFANGKPCFAVIIALCQGGEIRGGWIHDPIGNTTTTAILGEGAWENGHRLKVADGVPVGEMAGTMGERMRKKVDVLRDEGDNTVPAKGVRLGCAGRQYMDLVRGRLHFSRYGQLKPWDHAAGILIHREAGGYSALMETGDAYTPEPRVVPGPFLLAPSKDCWRSLHRVLTRL
jgi:fructose-1,6-bisphosphatase/inositol monophosphatase family enzyme